MEEIVVPLEHDIIVDSSVEEEHGDFPLLSFICNILSIQCDIPLFSYGVILNEEDGSYV